MSCCLTLSCLAQISDTIEVSYTKSAYLMFAGESVKYDCGSEDVLVRNSGSKLIIQSGVENFEETNLFVETESEVFMFIIVFKDNPSKFLYDFAKVNFVSETDLDVSGVKKEVSEIKKKTLTDQEQEYVDISKIIIDSKDVVFNRGVSKYKIGVYLRDAVIYNDKIYLEFEVENNSNIAYIMDYYKLRVKPVKRRLKDESFQEIELNPLFQYLRPERIEGKSSYRYVVVLDKFVLTDGKKLVVEHWENNGEDMNIEGGRKIDFDIFSKDILNVRVI